MLTVKQKRHLQALGSLIQPVVQVGKAGVLDTVVGNADAALLAHELIKVRVLRNCSEGRDEVIMGLARATGSEVVQLIGRNGLLFRRNPEKSKIEMPL